MTEIQTSNMIIGKTSAAYVVGFTANQFWKYVEKGVAPPYKLIDGRFVWDKESLLTWRATYPFRGKGRPKKIKPKE